MRARGRWLLAMSVSLAAPHSAKAALATAGVASAHDFAIPAQPLATALIAFGKQANVQVLTSGNAIASFRSVGANGQLSTDAALRQLLQGTGLVYQFTNARTVVVKPRDVAGKTASASGKSEGIEIKDLAPVETIAPLDRDIGFVGKVNSSAARNDALLIDVPQSVTVVTRDLMDAQQGLSVADALRNVAGVQAIDTYNGIPSFQIRGFNTGNGMVDGMPSNIVGSGDVPPLIGLQRVEVLKGPQSILGDSTGSNFGGLVNIAIKQPQLEPVRQFSYALGEQGETQAGLDLAGPLGRYAGFTYRLVVSGEYADRSPQGFGERRSAYVAPSLGWQGPSTTLVAGWQHMLNRLPIPDHVILLNDSVSSAAPFGLLPGNPDDHSTYRTDRIYYLLDQQLSGTWSWRSRGQYVVQQNQDSHWAMHQPQPDGEVTPVAERFRYDDAYYSLQNDLVGMFGTGAVTQTVTAGFDYSRSQLGRIDYYWHALATDGYNVFTGAPLPPVSSVVLPADDIVQAGLPWQTESGVFLQDQVAMGERWNLLMTLRRVAYEVQTNDADGNLWTPSHVKWVVNGGLVYKLTPTVAIYGSAASGFEPIAYLGENGRPLTPVLTRQAEAGTKFDLLDQRARFTVSLYRITLDHSYYFISPEPPNFGTYGPGQVNRGAELEFAGQVTQGLALSASYTNAHISNRDGTPAVGLPRQRFNLWASYWFQGALLNGWGVAGGVVARSRATGMESDQITYFDIPGQAAVDANVSYRAAAWRVTLGVKNMLDRRLYADNFNETFVPLHTRRTFMLTGTYDF